MRRFAVAAAMVLLGAVLLVAVGANSSAPDPTCAKDMNEDACRSSVGAVVRRGLPALHPLIVATRVEPGPKPGSQDIGHRATVEFDMFGLPAPLAIELYYDAGGHWGGKAVQSEQEVAAWALVPIVLASLVALGLLMVGWARRRSATGEGAP